MRGRDVLLEVLRSEGVRHVFGNPGSTELPLIDALAGAEDIGYVLALQEATAVGMADGYAQVTGRPAFLNLHTAAGVGNAIGNLTNAVANGTPLVVTAGQQDVRHLYADPLLSGDLTGLARPVSKWVHELRTPDELGVYLRRAFADAQHPPSGPVFLSLPMNLLEQETGVPPPAPAEIVRASVAGGLDQVAERLTEVAVGELALVAGDEVAASGAVPALVELAEALGAPVWGSPLYGRGVFLGDHPLWQGTLPLAAAQVRATLTPFRRVFLVGGQAFMAYPYSEGSPLPEGADLVHLSPAPGHLSRAHRTLLGVVGDPGATLTALLPLVDGRRDADAAAAQLADASVRRAARLAEFDETARQRSGPAPIDPMTAAHGLLAGAPADAIVVDEAITTGQYVRGFHHRMAPGRYLCSRGGGLGWGMPAAVGAALGSGAPTLCIVGDGSALYSPQALWTAARLGLPVVVAVVNNRQYLILKTYLRAMQGDTVRTGRFVAMDLVDPAVDFVALAASMGVAGLRVDHGDDLADAVATAFASGRPALVEVPISAP